MKKTIVVHQESGIEQSPILPDIPLTRREFLAGSAILTGTLAIGTTLSTLAPSRVWAAEMSVLNEREASRYRCRRCGRRRLIQKWNGSVG